MSRSISIVIPTYNGLKLLKKNLSSVISTIKQYSGQVELIIVDDGSSDQTVEWLSNKFELMPEIDRNNEEFRLLMSTKASFPIRLIVNQRNLRFAGAVNRGVNQAEGELVFLLNNDVSPHEQVLPRLASWFDQDRVFGVGCLEIEQNLDGIKGGKNKLWFERGLFYHSRAEDFETGETAWVSGGSGMFDRQKWLLLGGFDLDYYPAYWEDVDLSFRARENSWRILFDQEAVVNHNHESTNKTAFGQRRIELISWRNANKFVWKNGTTEQKLLNLVWRPYYWWLRYIKPLFASLNK